VEIAGQYDNDHAQTMDLCSRSEQGSIGSLQGAIRVINFLLNESSSPRQTRGSLQIARHVSRFHGGGAASPLLAICRTDSQRRLPPRRPIWHLKLRLTPQQKRE